MGTPQTLLELAGVTPAPPPLDKAALVLIDCQMEYVTGRLPLSGIDAALDEAEQVLAYARAKGVPVIHVQQLGRGQGLFSSATPYFEIAPQVAPESDEQVIRKGKPNAFAGTELDETLKAMGRGHLIVAGFMTHMCVSSTVRAALDLGYGCTVVAGACATRDLPDGHGGVVEAANLHAAELAALADRFAAVLDDAGSLGA